MTPAPQPHILLVDDEESLAAINARILQLLGYRVTTCEDGSTALRTFMDNPDGFHAVLTDQSMPGLSGLDLATEILHLRPALPIILLTGHTDSVTPALVQRLGLHSLLPKPYTTSDLRRALAQALAPVGQIAAQASPPASPVA